MDKEENNVNLYQVFSVCFVIFLIPIRDVEASTSLWVGSFQNPFYTIKITSTKFPLVEFHIRTAYGMSPNGNVF